MMLKLLLQLLFSVVGGVEALGGGIGSGGRLAFGIPPHIVDGHVLAVKVCTVPHVLYGGGAQEVVHVLVAVELVGQGVEQAVAFGGKSVVVKRGVRFKCMLTIATDAACIQGICI